MRLLGVVGAALVLGLVLGVTGAHAQPALDKPPFTASPAELLAVARAAPSSAPIVILREETHRRFDAQGRSTRRWRLVFVVRSQEGADEWAALSYEWHPFYQDRPQIRGRVISPQGQVTGFDLARATDAPAIVASPGVVSDRRRLELALPPLEIGSIVEEEIITQEHSPLLAAGTAEMLQIGRRGMAVESELLTVSAPVALKARVHTGGTDKHVVLRRVVAGGREEWTLQLGPQTRLPPFESWAPAEIVQQPYLGVATGASWNAVARDYHRIIDGQIAAGPVSLPPGIPRAPTVETARALVAWIHEKVRDTGIGYAYGPITPSPPTETLKRGSGDSKDKATLLVALLRQAGIPADLALLAAGPGADVDAGLPGMGMFNHVIVRARVEGRDLWIDATAELSPVGELPARAQSRRALVISDDTRTLQLTPKSTPADTTVREVRTFELAEAGAARVTESSRESGPFAAEMRGWIRDSKPEEVRERLAKYVELEYRSESLERFTISSPPDPRTPFEMTVEAARSWRAYTYRDHIQIYLFPSDVIAKLPASLTGADADETHARRLPFELLVPHTYEIENRLVIPAGYDLPVPTPPRTRTLGVMTLTEAQRLDGRTLVVHYRLDTGNPRMTPAELEVTQHALQALGQEVLEIKIDHTAWSLISAGKLQEAVAAVEELIRLHPKEALHYTQLASVYLHAGAGQAARRAARKAVALEPRNADAYVVLGWALRHDSLGREYGFDHDRAGAIAAYRTARKLDPTHLGAPSDLATLLERDPRGVRYGVGADLPGAAEAWRAARAIEDSAEDGLALVRVLLWDGKFSEAEAIARDLPVSDERDELYVTAIALARSAADAVMAARSMSDGDERVELLARAAASLTQLRAYARGRELVTHAGLTTPQAQLLGRLQRQTVGPGPGRDPTTAFHDVLHAGLVPAYRSRSASSAHVASALYEAIRAPELVELEEQLGAGAVWDLARSVAAVSIDGPPGGPWRVRGELLDHEVTMYVARDRGVAKVFAGPGTLRNLGTQALRSLAAGDEAGARQCMDWARAEFDLGAIELLKALRFEELWGPGLPSDRDALALAAAVLSMRETGIPVLEKCVTSVADARSICDLALGFALSDARRWAALERHATAWRPRAQGLPAEIATDLGALAQIYLGKYAQAAATYDAILAKEPGDLRARRRRAMIAHAAGDIAGAIHQLEDVVKRRRSLAEDRNNLAWLLASVGKDLPRALSLAQVAAKREKDRPSVLNTLAVVAAELGDLKRALDEGWRAMELAHRTTPGDADWYLVARIYEQLGLRDDAIAAYRRIPRPAIDDVFLPSAYRLARERLAQLGVKLPAR